MFYVSDTQGETQNTALNFDPQVRFTTQHVLKYQILSVLMIMYMSGACLYLTCDVLCDVGHIRQVKATGNIIFEVKATWDAIFEVKATRDMIFEVKATHGT